MIEVKNISKTYKSKGGVITKALDNVSIKFPEKGLVFLLGKSGSGKSTLLNMIGGLDYPDSGEIIVKGRSSSSFSRSDFDSYRNTYIGFIFQEYNILEEFNIEQNIALALQLQGKKSNKEAVNALLKEVDLEGFNKRKPNTLSGGQKQRIAIARALIKSPEIIMADEPTGALDSATGRQVLTTLKKLSATKLVIIVSHDQDFAEEYGDRIVELMDGKIISDKTKEFVKPTSINENIEVINGNIIDIKNGSKLTDADIKKIAQILKAQNKEVMISTGENNITKIKKASRIQANNHGERFNDTKAVETKTYDGNRTKFIRSHMPFSRSFKMGASSLKTKPIRLFFTILLSVVSFTMFGVATTLMFYNPSYSVYKALEGTTRKSETLVKSYKYLNQNVNYNHQTGEIGKVTSEYETTGITPFGESEIEELNNKSSKGTMGLFTFSSSYYQGNTPIRFDFKNKTKDLNTYYSVTGFIGLSDNAKNAMLKAGYSIIGNYPTNANEIAISNYHYEVFKEAGEFLDKGKTMEEAVNDNLYITISFNNKNGFYTQKDMHITGIYDFGATPSKFDELKGPRPATQSPDERRKIETEFSDFISGSTYLCGFVHPSFYNTYGYLPSSQTIIYEAKATGVNFFRNKKDAEDDNVNPDYTRNTYIYEENENKLFYYDLNFNAVDKIVIGNNDILLPYNSYYYQYKTAKYFTPLEQEKNVLGYSSSNYHAINKFLEKLDQYNYSEDPYNQAYRRIYNYCSTTDDNYESGYSLSNDIDYIKQGMTEQYDIITVRNYIRYLRDALTSYYYGHTSEKPSNWESDYEYLDIGPMNDTHFNNFKENITNFYNAVNDPLKGLTTYAQASAFMNGVDQKTQDELRNLNYPDALRDLYNNIGDENSINKVRHIYENMFHKIYGSEATISYDYNPECMKIIFTENLPTFESYMKDSQNNVTKLNVKGFVMVPNNYSYTPVLNRATLYNYLIDSYQYMNIIKTDYQAPSDAKYSLALSFTSYSQSDIEVMTKQYDTYNYDMTNTRYLSVSSWTKTINSMKNIFLIIGAVTGGLATLLLLNFISVSISNKRKDIGILRAVGARGTDVFKIFFSESSIISFICFVLSSIATGVVCYFLNDSIVNSPLGLSLIDFGVINIGFIFALTLIIGFIATIIPVSVAAHKPPVEAIRSL